MAIQKQMIPYPLVKGADLGVDRMLATGLLQSDDVVFDDSDTVKQRGGLVQGFSGAADAAIRAFTQRGTPAVETVSGAMWQGDTGKQFTGNFPRAAALTQRVQSIAKTDTASTIQNYDVAYSDSSYCLAYEVPASGANLATVRFSVRSKVSDAEISGLQFVSTTDTYANPRVLALPTGFVFVYLRQTGGVWGIYAQRVDAAGSTVVGETLLINTLTAGTAYDAAMCSDGLRFSVVGIAANILSSQITVNTLATALAHPVAAYATAPTSITAHCLVSAGVYTTMFLYGAGTNLRGRSVPSNTNVLTAEITLYAAGAGNTVGRVAVHAFQATDYFVAFDTICQPLGTYYYGITRYLTTTSVLGALGAIGKTTSHHCIGGRFFVMGGRLQLPLISFYPSTGTNTARALLVADAQYAYETIDGTDPEIPLHLTARIDQFEVVRANLVALAGQKKRVPGVQVDTVTGIAHVYYLKFETDLLFAGLTNDTGIAVARCDLDPNSQLGYVEANGTTLLAGACPLVCDSQQIFEDGFNFPPEILGSVVMGAAPAASTTTTITVGPFTLSSTYTLALTEAWMDAAGNWHESRPTNFYSLTVGGANPYATIPIARPFSLKDSTRRRLLLYRTKPSSTDTNLYLALDSAGNFISDTDLGSGEVLYTTTRPAQDGMPACRHLATGNNRIFAAGCGDGSKVYFSQLIDRGYGVAWDVTDANFQQTIPTRSGRVVGTAEMDGKQVIVCEEQCGYILGNGPDATGVGAYASYETVIADQGASWDSPRSIGQGGDGVWFYTARGLRVLGRANELLRNEEGGLVGSKLDSLLVTEAGVTYVQNSSNQLVRFFNNGYCYVYDTQWKQWSRFTNHAAADAVYAYAYDQFWHFNSTFGYYYGETTYMDPGSTAISCYVQGPHMQFGGLQGFQRVQKMLAIFDGAPDAVNVACAYDFGTLNVEANAGASAQFRHDFVTQKCQALSVQLNWTSTSKRPRLSAVSLQVAVKPGPFRIGSGGTY